MKSVYDQVKDGQLVCPVTKQTLSFLTNELRTQDGLRTYPVANGTPIFLDPDLQREYISENGGEMSQKYETKPPRRFSLRWFDRKLFSGGRPDYRPASCRDAKRTAIDQQPDDALCVAVGGGPMRHGPNLVNINIGLFDNVDIVADAYNLPYADECVDAVFIEAVLEHLEFPEKAVAEIHRVLRKGGQVFAATPFLQHYHGYPNHFQNFTLTGHSRMLERSGLAIISDGVAVGPTKMLFAITSQYLDIAVQSKVIRGIAKRLLSLFARMFIPLDRILNTRPNASNLCSLTYAHAAKPE